MADRTLILVCAFLVGMCVITTGNIAGAPQTVCKIVWLLGLPCPQVNSAMVSQIKQMTSFKLDTVTPDFIRANQTAHVWQEQSINFTMMDVAMGQGCQVAGTSVSATWYIKLDNGTNYCNLRSVLQGSGLTNASGFTEYSNDWICSGYGASACIDTL